ncbi:Integrin alpha-3 [Cucumis melo var. makuwa]|uniref:Integrin alpha-3 n=1 Tax=Cucumis melo var. makuwa TaxID=1194695 RepID=A0A5A7U807_CUCMM|nr:Integrin alpha-3 [Cucumis melo var. makuwa]TYK03533.1 Integrin alpha-3 [Cucumis melo var. makuwa]
MSSTFSPSRSPGSSRLQQLGPVSGVSRLRSSSLKKPPEPLRRAVTDCLSSSAANSHHGGPSASVLVAEASRTLRLSHSHSKLLHLDFRLVNQLASVVANSPSGMVVLFASNPNVGSELLEVFQPKTDLRVFSWKS